MTLTIATGKTVELQGGGTLCGSPSESFAFSRDSRRIAAADGPGYAYVWDGAPGGCSDR